MSSSNGLSETEPTVGSGSSRDVPELLGVLSAAQSTGGGRRGPVSEADEDSGPFGFALAIARKKWQVAAATVAGGVLAGIISVLIPNTYTATAVLMPPQQNQSSASALLGQLGGLAAMAGSASMGLKSPGDLYIGLMESRSLSDSLVDKFNLMHVYGVKTRTDARLKLAAHRRFTAGRDSLIHIDVEDTNPKLAADIANSYVADLNAKNTALAASDAGQKRLFLENRLKDEKTALTAAEDAMKNLQQQSGILQVENQAHVAINAIAQLQAQIVAREVMLQRIKMGATSANPEVVNAEAELGGLRAQLRKLEDSSTAQSSGDPLVPMSRLPSAGLNYLRNMRELKFHEFLFELLTKQYEAARLDESKEAPALPLVDRAVPPEKKSAPRRAAMVMAGLFASAVFSCAVVCLSHGMRHTQAGDKLRQLKLALLAAPG